MASTKTSKLIAAEVKEVFQEAETLRNDLTKMVAQGKDRLDAKDAKNMIKDFTKFETKATTAISHAKPFQQ